MSLFEDMMKTAFEEAAKIKPRAPINQNAELAPVVFTIGEATAIMTEVLDSDEARMLSLLAIGPTVYAGHVRTAVAKLIDIVTAFREEAENDGTKA